MRSINSIITAVLSTLALAWACAVVSGGIGIDALIKLNQERGLLKKSVPPPNINIQAMTYALPLSILMGSANFPIEIFYTAVVLTAVTVIIAVLCSIFLLMFNPFTYSLAIRSLRTQSYLLIFFATGLFVTLIPFDVYFVNNRTAFIRGIALPLQVTEQALDTYRKANYLQLLAILPWFTVLFTMMAAIVLFMASSRIGSAAFGDTYWDPGMAEMENSAEGPKCFDLWSEDTPSTQSVAKWSETAKPLPAPPRSELRNPIVNRTIAENPSLFKIVTPINVNRFEELLRNHPNPAFVASVCRGLREGFWPWAKTDMVGYPITYDGSLPPPKNPLKAAFLESQCLEEITKQRFSPSFGPHLLPGMYSMPIYAVPKSNSDFRMISDHSAGEFSLNSMIPREDTMGYPLDNMRRLSDILVHIRQTKGHGRLTLFKSDIAEAYRILPVHPHWQIKQVNTVNGERYVDRNNAFGGRGAGCIFIAFNSLVTWIAINVKGIDMLSVYCDDSFSPEWSNRLTWDPIYKKEMPTNQVRLLELWRELGIPYKEKKQVYGSPLTIIGIEVDPNKMTMSLPKEARDKLVNEIEDFCRLSFGSRGVKHPLRRWQCLAGWLNWSFNVFPLLRPALNNLYPMISGKDVPNQLIRTNHVIRQDLQWAAKHIETSDGIHILQSLNWSPEEADLIYYCNACLDGMGFWLLGSNLGFYAPLPPGIKKNFIYFYETLCVLAALKNAVSRSFVPRKVVILTDSANAVSMFSSLRAKPSCNDILMRAVDLQMRFKYQLRVLHVPGTENEVADAISRRNFAKARRHCPGLSIAFFKPPRVTLGETRK